MDFWNIKLDDPNHTKNVMRTTSQMLESLNEYNKKIMEEDMLYFQMDLGYSTVTFIVGDMGISQHFHYTYPSSRVNLVSKLERKHKS